MKVDYLRTSTMCRRWYSEVDRKLDWNYRYYAPERIAINVEIHANINML